jgi:ribosome-associated protein
MIETNRGQGFLTPVNGKVKIQMRYQKGSALHDELSLMFGMAQVGASPEVIDTNPTEMPGPAPFSGENRPEGGLLKLATTGTFLLPALDRACLAARVAADNKAHDVLVLDMRSITPLYDFFVIATGNSRRLVHTVTEAIDAELVRHGDRRRSIEGYEASTWVMQDYGDIVVHVFNPQTREYYGLEELWADAPRIDWENHDVPEPHE